MSNQGIWITDPDTKEERFIFYHELEEDVIQSFIRPIGGFVFPADLFCLANLPSVPFYVRDWLPKRGKSLLYAPPKSGKSYLCLQLARCIASNESFLGIPTTSGSVLYIQWELGEEILQDRLRRTGKSYEGVFVGTTFSIKLDSLVGQQQLWRAMTAVEPQVLILDPWYKAIQGDEDKATEMREALDFLDSLIEGFNCSIFIIHHAGKDLSKRGRGSSILEDWVDSYLQMQKVSKAGERLRVKIRPIFLRHAQEPPEAIQAELGDDFEFHLISGKTPKQLVEEFIKQAGKPVSPAELFAAQLGAHTTIYRVLKELTEEGKVVKKERGEYERGG